MKKSHDSEGSAAPHAQTSRNLNNTRAGESVSAAAGQMLTTKETILRRAYLSRSSLLIAHHQLFNIHLLAACGLHH